MSSVEFKAATKVYDDGTVALDSLNLKVEQGEFLVLLGSSGCGKSTALRLLAGLEDITSGEVRIGDTKVNDLPPGARGLGMVFQSYALYPHMSVRENLSFGLRRAKGSARLDSKQISIRINEAAEMLDIHRALDKKPKELSGGQQQRVAIGRALVRRPKVLLMDEPLSNLDTKLRSKMRFELRRLHELHGTTTLYVTHDQIEAMTLADRIAILTNGKLQQHAEPLVAYHQPENTFVASFLGTPPMNLIDGTAENGRFVAGDLSFDLPPHLSRRNGSGTFGIRPEHVKILDEAGTCCDVGDVERLGGENICHLTIDGHQIKVLWHRSGGDAVASVYGNNAKMNVSLAVPEAVFFEN